MSRGTDRWDEARLQGRLWTPDAHRAEGSLYAWFDASDLTTVVLDVSSRVSDWLDRSGNQRHTAQAASTNRPTFEANVFPRGLPGIKGGGSGSGTVHRLLTTASYTLAQPITVYSVLKAHANGAAWPRFPISFDGIKSTTPTGRIIIRPSDDATNDVMIFAGTAVLIGGDLVAQQVSIIGGAFNGANSIGDRNGTETAAVNPGVGGFSNGFMLLGGAAAETEVNSFHGEFIILSKFAEGHERKRLAGYLSWKWGAVDQLPGSHPFKNRPPLVGD
jgi:hypothetical protein